MVLLRIAGLALALASLLCPTLLLARQDEPLILDPDVSFDPGIDFGFDEDIFSGVELVNDIWMARSLTMMNLVSNRLSNMAFLEIYTDVDVEDEFLTTRTLTDVAFRESELEKLRQQVD